MPIKPVVSIRHIEVFLIPCRPGKAPTGVFASIPPGPYEIRPFCTAVYLLRHFFQPVDNGSATAISVVVLTFIPGVRLRSSQSAAHPAWLRDQHHSIRRTLYIRGIIVWQGRTVPFR